MKKLAVLFVGIVLTLIVFLMHTRMQVREAHDEIEQLKSLIEEVGEPDLVAGMGRIQLYMEKLWQAGSVGNTELAEFYRHEIEEVLEELAEAGISDDGHDLSLRIEQMALPVLEAWEAKGIEADSTEFEASYLGLMNACNSCHQVTDHGYIRITKPGHLETSNQAFILP